MSQDSHTDRKEDIFSKREEKERGCFSLTLERLHLITCMSKYFFSIWVHLGRGDSLPRRELHSEASWWHPSCAGLTSRWRGGRRRLAAPWSSWPGLCLLAPPSRRPGALPSWCNTCQDRPGTERQADMSAARSLGETHAWVRKGTIFSTS